MDAHELVQLRARRRAEGRPYLEFMRSAVILLVFGPAEGVRAGAG